MATRARRDASTRTPRAARVRPRSRRTCPRAYGSGGRMSTSS